MPMLAKCCCVYQQSQDKTCSSRKKEKPRNHADRKDSGAQHVLSQELLSLGRLIEHAKQTCHAPCKETAWCRWGGRVVHEVM